MKLLGWMKSRRERVTVYMVLAWPENENLLPEIQKILEAATPGEHGFFVLMTELKNGVREYLLDTERRYIWKALRQLEAMGALGMMDFYEYIPIEDMEDRTA